MVGVGIKKPVAVASKFSAQLERSRLRLAGITAALTLVGTSGALAQNCNPGVGVFPNIGVIAGTSSAVAGTLGNVSTVFVAQQTSAFVAGATATQPNQASGGVWARAVGGRADISSDTTFTFAPVGGTPLVGTCTSEVRQHFWGVQAGFDIARLDLNGWNVHWGTTAGYLEARGEDIPPGLLESNFQVPFIGSYLVVTRGSFFADVTLRREYYNITLNQPALAFFDQPLGGRGWTFSIGAGYNFGLQDGWFIEPSAGFVWSRTEIDAFAVGGLPVGFPGLGVLQIDDIESAIGRATLRIGRNFATDGLAVQPFASVSVFHEFADDVTAKFLSCPGCTGGLFAVTSETSRVGTYVQLSAGVAAQVLNTGWVGFVRGDYRKGEDIESLAGNAGLRYNFVPEALAPRGKMVVKGPPIPPPLYSWSGFYIGGHFGAAQGRGLVEFLGTPVEAEPYISGYLLGAQAGFNFQSGPLVFGLEGEITSTNANGAETCGAATGLPFPPAFSPLFLTCENSFDWIATLSARVGITWWSDRTLTYVKVGGAWAREDVTVRCIFQPPIGTTFTCANPAGAQTFGFTASDTKLGGLVGFGTEFGLTRAWSARAELNFIWFGDDEVSANDGTRLNIGAHLTQAKIGLNYRFQPYSP